MNAEAHTDFSEALDRLANFAKSKGTTAPTKMTDPDGGPSQELLAFCNTHDLTLDWAVLGVSPMYRKRKTLSDVHYDAVMLQGIIEGAEVLMEATGGKEERPVRLSNASATLVMDATNKVRKLVEDLDQLEMRPKSKIQRLFEQHQQGPKADREALEAEIMALPSKYAADFAVKAILSTSRGEVMLDWKTDPFWQEARELTGAAA